MISIRTLDRNKYAIFRLAYSEGAKFEICYRGKVFILSIEPTGQTYKVRPPLERMHDYKRRQKKGPVKVQTKTCRKCGCIKIVDICINKDCPTNKSEKA